MTSDQELEARMSTAAFKKWSQRVLEQPYVQSALPKKKGKVLCRQREIFGNFYYSSFTPSPPKKIFIPGVALFSFCSYVVKLKFVAYRSQTHKQLSPRITQTERPNYHYKNNPLISQNARPQPH